MATIKDIIDTARTLANDYCDVETFLFDESSCFNDERGKEYPVVLVECRGIDETPSRPNISFLPKSTQYRLKFYFADVYDNEQMNSGKTKEEAYQDVQRYKEQYFAELQTRLLNDPSLGVRIDSIAGGFLSNKGFNDCLAFTVCDVNFTVDSDCVLGQFSACP